MAKDRRKNQFTSGVSLSWNVANMVENYAKENSRTFSNSIEFLLKIAFQKIEEDKAIVAEAHNLKKKIETMEAKKQMSA